MKIYASSHTNYKEKIRIAMKEPQPYLQNHTQTKHVLIQTQKFEHLAQNYNSYSFKVR